jgi:signal recognition particle receptor subunit beta
VLLVASKNDLTGARPISEIASVLEVQEAVLASGNKWLSVGIQVNSNGETDGLVETRAKILELCK